MSVAEATSTPRSRRDPITWIAFAVAVLAVLVCIWALLTAWDAILHGNPAYAILLGATLVVSLAVVWLTWRTRGRRRKRVLRIVLIVLGAAWIALIAWLRPYSAVEPALAAMTSDAQVTISETATTIVMQPKDGGDKLGLLFQPGALVDPRAYAAVLRPLADAGHTVVIAKQPLGIAFLALGALDEARSAHPGITRWVVGGHSLGGTVAAIEADSPANGKAPATGLLLYASYPATDISSSLTALTTSISGSRDGLATPDKIAASRSDLPENSRFVVIEGASHAQFGDYGLQPGDGTPTISHDDARRQISAATVAFFGDLSGTN